MSTTTHEKKKLLPPTPKEKHWLFGSGYALRDRTHEVVPELIEKYGEVIGLTLPFTRILIAAKPEYAKHVLLENNKNYRKSLAYDMIRVLLGNGLLTSEGDFWKKQRRLAMPAFHKQKLADLTAMMVRKAEAEVEKIKPNADSGGYFDVAPLMTNLTLEIISEAIFSNGVEDKADLVSRQITLLNQYATDKLNSPIRLPPLFPTPGNIKERKAIKILDDIIYSIIDQRRKEGVSKSDLLSMLLDARDEETGEAMDNKQLRDEVMTIFIAGNETTANAMAWTLYLLSQNPEAEGKMIREIDEKLDAGVELNFQNILGFQYVRQVIDESMRLFPPAWVVGRRNYEDDEIGGYFIQKNTNVLVPIMYFHRSEKYWDEPLKFKPERFAPELRNSIDRFVYFPFGGGPRLCIGNNFAIMEMQIILIKLYRSYKFRLKPGFVVEPEPLITLRPKYGMVMKAEKR
ncbi:MAG TPA: cytochrome P450 [Chitinophagales bacterium]|nr:cytochrome P450 [Chitinophagales bacterium]